MVRSRFASFSPIAALMLAAFVLSGCAGTVIGAGAAVGVAAYDERGIAGVAKDQKIAFDIRDSWLRHDHEFPVKLSVEVYEGRALVTGVIDDEQMRADAVKLAWKAEGVAEVINEIQVSGSTDLLNLARDSWVTAKLKSILTFDQEIMAINYSIETVNGIVYLIGIAQSQEELDRVIAHARGIEYVRKVINHVRVRSPS